MIWKFILEKFAEQKRVALLLVLESLGSSPGRQGFKMAVSSDGDMNGSVGGGIMEHKFVQLIKNRFETNSNLETKVHRQVHKPGVSDKSGMICSGEQTLFVYEVTEDDIGAIQKIADAFKFNYRNIIEISNKGISFSEIKPDFDFYTEKDDDSFIYREQTGFKNEIHIIGGGHCSLALSELMSKMDFYISVYDDRPDLNTLVQNNFAHSIKILNSYDDLLNFEDNKKNLFVVIMTFGYRTDLQALKALNHKKFKYLGLLGSQNKIEKMFSELPEAGFSPQWLRQVYSPAGLPIKSKTPFEIAVSIAAEIIQVKNCE